jgi:CheY-like chemotaxis protein
MRLTGKVVDLPMLDLLQYLHAGSKTGTLILTREDEKAYVYFQNGNIVHAISPQRSTIGDMLLKSKDIDLKTLKTALVLQAEQCRDKAIGQILVELGAITQDRLKEVIVDQIREAIRHLTSWSDGEFLFEHNEIMPVDDINLNPTSILPVSDVNSRGLLMEAAQHLFENDRIEDGRTVDDTAFGVPPQAEFPGTEKPAPSVAVEEAPAPSEEFTENKGKKKAESRNCPVLLLTADGIFRNLLRVELANEGFEISTPSTMRECLEKAEQYNSRGLIPVILSEGRMPMERRSAPGTGALLLKEIEKAGWSFPVLIMVESFDYDSMKVLYELGSRAVLPKPVRNDTIETDYTSNIKAFNAVVSSLVRRIESSKKAGFDDNGR